MKIQNEKVLFTNELFGKDSEAFKMHIDNLNNKSNFEEAKQILTGWNFLRHNKEIHLQLEGLAGAKDMALTTLGVDHRDLVDLDFPTTPTGILAAAAVDGAEALIAPGVGPLEVFVSDLFGAALLQVLHQLAAGL